MCIYLKLSAASAQAKGGARCHGVFQARISGRCETDRSSGLRPGVSKAMAFRMKYRTTTDAGQIKRRLPLLTLSVHPENRGGVNPQGDDAKQLATRLAKAGFSQEEADHQGVCVQEPPADAVAACSHGQPEVAVGYAQYNQQHCQGSDVLSACFGPDASANHGLLSHNHLLLVLLSWLNGAEWDLDEEERQVLATGTDGRLDLEAAVAVKNLQELRKTCRGACWWKSCAGKPLWKSLGLVP